jgi:hypothetical protein
LCLPARDESDEIAGMMLAQVLEHEGICAEPVSVTALASEVVAMVGERGAQLICVSALPPSAVSHARYLCKRLHAKYPEIEMVVGLWTAKGDLVRAKERIVCGEKVAVVSAFSAAMETIRQMMQPLILKTEEERKGEERGPGSGVRG